MSAGQEQREDGADLAEAALDDVLTVAAAACASPMAGIVLAGRTRLLSAGGARPGDAERTAGWVAAGRHVAEHGAPLDVADLIADERFPVPPESAEAAARRFFGVPLVAGDGGVVGSLFVAWADAEGIGEHHRLALAALGRRVAAAEGLRQAAATAHRAQEQLADAQCIAGTGSWEWDVAGDVVRWSDHLFRLFGREPGAVVGSYQAYLEAVHPDDRNLITDAVGRALADGGDFAFDHRVVWSDGTVRWLQGRGVVDATPDGTPVRMRGTATDVSDRVALQEELAALALVDELTGVHNRRGFLTLAEHQRKLATRAGRQLRMVFVDIDGMKTINDTYGHAEGDRALAAVAEVLRQTFRAGDVVARLGGDEFCVLVVEDGTGTHVDLDGRLTSLRSVPPAPDRPYALSLSVGLATVAPTAETSVEDLLRRADGAMYLDKGSPRRRARVLVVEDDPSLRRLAELSLRSRFDVTTAGTGMEAVDRATTQAPDIVLLDLGLPDIPGPEVLRRLRERPGGDRLPVIVFTASGERSTQLDTLRDGVDDYLVKPIDLEILEARIDSVLRRALSRPQRLGV